MTLKNHISKALINRLPPQTAQRVYSIDTFRLVSIFFVILRHVEVFRYSYQVYYPNPVFAFLYYFPLTIRLLPFFFIAAGYFFHKGILKGEPLSKRLLNYSMRLMRLYVLWFLFYSFIFAPEGTKSAGLNPWEIFCLNMSNAVSHPVVTFVSGTANLWFFPALVMGLIIVVVLHKLRMEKWIIPVGFILYLMTLFSRAYSVFPLGYHVDFNMRHGPFFSTLFVGIGWLLARKNNFRLRTAIFLITMGFLVEFAEIIYFYAWHGLKLPHGCLLGYIFVNTGVFWLVLARPNIGKGTVFPKWGKLTLGVYCTHAFVMKYISGWLKPFMHPVAYDVMRPIAIYLLCLVLTVILMQNKYTRKLVT